MQVHVGCVFRIFKVFFVIVMARTLYGCGIIFVLSAQENAQKYANVVQFKQIEKNAQWPVAK